MFHVKHLLWRRRPPRPRILGHTKPYYLEQAGDVFAQVGGAATLAIHASPAEHPLRLAELGDAFQLCHLYANDTLLETIRHYCLAVQAYTRGDTSQEEVDVAEAEFYAACREALGTNN